MKKIVNIIIFTIAGIACLFALIFSFNFDEKSMANYKATGQVKAAAPEMLEELSAANVDNLQEFITKYQSQIEERSKLNKEAQNKKEILYTFITSLKEIGKDQEKFDQYKVDFAFYSARLIAEEPTAQSYVEKFNKVENLDKLQGYILELEDEYAAVKQDYLVEVENIKALNFLLEQVSHIDANISVQKKEIELKELQDNVSSFKAGAVQLNLAIYGFYIVFFITVGLLAFFAIFHLVKNFKSSIGVLLGVALLIVVAIIGYFVSTDQLTDVAIKLQTSPGEMKWVGAGIILFYVIFFGAIAAVIGSLIMNFVKKYR
ncbi:MAG TPA: hypothetical protein PLH70_08615 [Bacteroidales bacterium]|nr:hypothetical protein [Bacteroidales bacterium]HOH22075.1 hypothetical protein [Bacteroidales bacterium]HPZ04200.1 hypothetical protein [Bacteroidales bacterium]HQB75846.1 hypothetical protein [Bacteroidales bacterium]